MQDQIKLCKSLAKSESLSLKEENNLAALEKEVASLMQSENELDFSKGRGSKELFIIFLYMYAQYKAQEPSKGFMALIIEILKRAQAHIVNRKKGASQATEETKANSAEGGEVDISNEINLDIDISLRNDEKLQSLLEVIAQI